MDISDLEKKLGIDGMSADEQMAMVLALQKSAEEKSQIARDETIGKSAELVIQGLKKIKSDIETRFSELNTTIQSKVTSLQDGKDGRDGKDGKNGLEGKQGLQGSNGKDGRDGVDGSDGIDGISVTSAHIDFDGSLIIGLSSGVELNVGEVVAPDLAERIKVITNGGGTSQSVLDTLASLQTQINTLIPSQTGNSGKYLTTNGTSTSWASIASAGLSYQGTWNASTNSPTLASSIGTNGYYYIVGTSGSTNLNGITDWVIGDWLLFNGTVWQKIDQTNSVTSVAGRTGDITLTTADVSGLGTIATQASSNVSITGGSITGITDLAVADGGTGSSTAQAAINTLAGAVTSGSYLRGNGTNVVMNTIQAADVPTLNQSTTGSAATLTTGRTIAITGDLAYTSPSFNGSTNVTATGTLATVNTNVGSFTNATLTINGKGLITAASSGTAPVTSVTATSPVASTGGTTPAISLASGYGDTLNPYASKTANYVLAAPNGSAGVPTFRAVVAADIPTLNQNTTGTASNVTGTVAIANGGTGSTTAATALTALGAYPSANPSGYTSNTGTVTSVGGTGTVSGLTLTGTVTTSGNLTLGGAITGFATSGANTNLTSVALTTGTISTAPSSSTDIVNKSYADSIASGVNFHSACNYATTAALAANTYNNGSSGVGATLTAVAVGTLTIDGYTLVIGDVGKRLLIKNEVTQANNGVYTLTQAGTAVLPYILTRATDYDTSGSGTNEVDQGDMMLVLSGTTNGNTSWVQQTALPITIGTTALIFLQFAAIQTYTAGTGLSLSTNQFSITNVGTANTYGSAIQTPVLTTNAQGQVTAVTNTTITPAIGSITGLGTGVSTFLGTPTSANLATAVTDETGSGSLVFATSPTLVTPILGTPQSGNFSTGTFTWPTFNQNTTGTASNVTGTVAVANGGTGLTTTPANGALDIGNGTGFTRATLTAGSGISVTNSAGGITIANTSPSSGGTVTSVAAITLGTTGTDLSSTVANSTTTPVITLNVPTASATNRGVLTSTDWTTFNNKGSGTVTAVSVVSANGFAGTSSGGATPALTLSTSITGLLKGNATAISAATSGTDYSAGTSALTTGILKSTTTTGALSIAVAADFPTLNQNTTGTAANVTGTVAVANGGTGLTATPTNGQIDIGNGTGFTRATLTAGTGVTITNASGSITIAASGTGVTSVTGTSPVVSSGGTTPAISLATAYGDTLNPYASKTANYILAAPNGSAGVPTFRAIVAADIPTLNQNTTGTASNVTGTVAIANGGTGQTTASAGFNALSPITSTGDIIIGNGVNSATRLAIGTSGYVLTSNGTTATWSASTGGVTSFQTSLSGLTPSTASTGAVTLAGTLGLSSGGSGQTTAQLAMNAFAGAVTSGSYLRGNGTNVVMSTIQAADVPTLNQNTTGTASNVTGTVVVANGGTGVTTLTGVAYGNGTSAFTAATGSQIATAIGSTAVTNATNATTATNIASGTANQIPYQTGAGATSFISAPTLASTYLSWNGTAFAWAASAGVGTVTSVAQSFTGGLISVSGSPITTAGTLALTVAGTSGGIPYFSSASTWASSAALTQYGIVYGGGAGASPVATAAGTTGQVLLATTSAAPSWGQVSLTAGVTGALPVANGGTGLTTVPHTVQVFTSSSGTYTTPANVKAIWVRCVGGGAGGGASTSNPGSAGGNTTFGTSLLVANGGSAGSSGASVGGFGGAGGSASGGDISATGNSGSPGANVGTNGASNQAQPSGGTGGGSFFGGAGSGGLPNAAGSAAGGYGSGGGGGGSVQNAANSAGGGGAGGYTEKLIASPSATYSYAVGALGAGGAAGTYAGGSGSGGVIIITEYYV